MADVGGRAKLIEHGSDPDRVKKALEDATALARGLWLSFITFGTYLVITIAGVDHKQLFYAAPIKLPVLNSELPLFTFFWVAPILFVIFHLYLLLNLKLLADQVHHYIGLLDGSGLAAVDQDGAKLQLPNFVIVQVLGGTSGQRMSLAGRLMSFTAFLTLALGPVVLLLFAQLQFLPYHSRAVTDAQRLTLAVDILLIWYFWLKITRPRPRRWTRPAAAAASVAVVTLSVFVLVFPGEQNCPSGRNCGPLTRLLFYETNGQAVEEAWTNKQPDVGFFYNTLVLRDFRAVDIDLVDKITVREKDLDLKPGQGERSIDLQDRNFRNAVFIRIDLRRADLDRTNFDGATLSGAQLDWVSLNAASLNGANLEEAQLKEASLGDRTSLRGASLDFASLQGALLNGASLQGGFLGWALLQGASLDGASLQGASLGAASLQGASLDEASLQGASLHGASLQGASLHRALLQGASLDEASLQGASLEYAKVWRTEWNGSKDFDGARMGVIFDPVVWHERSARILGGTYRAWFSDIEAAALKGVPEAAVEDIREILAQLLPDEWSRDEDWSNRKLWYEANHLAFDESRYRISLATVLEDIACDAANGRHVVRGVINRRFTFTSRLEDAGGAALPLIDKMLDPEGKDCPGAKGLDPASIETLRALKAQYEAEPAAQPQPKGEVPVVLPHGTGEDNR